MKRRNKRKRNKVWKKRLLIALAIAGVLFFLSILTAFAYIAKVVKDLPDLEKAAQKVQLAQTTKIYAYNGTLIASLHAEENREVVKYSQISPDLRNAVIAIEDERFYDHQGVDLKAIIRALVVDITTGKKLEGGSTITQQYVKNIFLSDEKTFRRKIKEAILAYEIESLYTKEKILEKYLNTVYFGHGCYGVETASKVFFGKSAKKLRLEEAALLAGVIRAPQRYSPYDYPKKALERRNLVLNKMLELKYITAEEGKKAKKRPLKVKPIRPPKTKAPYFVEYVKQILINKYGANKVFKGGLRVKTTLDLEMQAQAEEAIHSTLDRKDDPSGALVAIEPKTGYIRAMVGGRDFEKQKFNLAAQGKRQPGSAFKVFVLVTAIEKGVSPSKTYLSSPLTIKLPGQDWVVRNSTRYGGGYMTIRQGTIHSVNALYARLIMDIGAENVVKTAKKMGITTPLQPNPAIALGGLRIGVSPLEMASAFGTLANNGEHAKPTAIIKITDANGKVIENNKPQLKPVISSVTAYLVNDILKDVIRYGTGWRANIYRPAAGKTGTTQVYRDAWFVGYTPQLSCAVWVGYPEGQISMYNIHGFSRVFGGTLPAIIWAKFMRAALADFPAEDFEAPKEGVVRVTICTESGLRATSYCPSTKLGIFPSGKSPTSYCKIHQGVRVPNVVGKSAQTAVKMLESEGLAVTQVLKYSSKVPLGVVISQDPSAGKAVKAGSKVTIVVSNGPEPKPAPPAPPPEEPTETPPSEETTSGG